MPNRIRELRKQKGITMKQLGASVGLAENVISRYETGKRQPDNDTLLKISKYFGVTVGYLLGAEENEKMPTANGEQKISDSRFIPADHEITFSLSRDELEVIEKYHCLDERGKSAVMAVLNHEYDILSEPTSFVSEDAE